MDQYHRPETGLFHLMDRKRANQIQPSSIDCIKPTTNTILDSSNINTNNITTSVSTFTSTSNTFTDDLDISKQEVYCQSLEQQQPQRTQNPQFPAEPFYTVPNLRTLLDRTLPTLPSSGNVRVSKKEQSNDIVTTSTTRQQRLNRHIHTRLQRAVTWLGTPFNKILNTSIDLPLMYNVNHGHLQQASNSKQSLNDETNQAIYCKVHQIVNHASSREYEYHLHLQLNNNTIETISGTMQKGPVGSARGYLDSDIPLNVNGPFDLTFVLMAQPLTRLTKVKHRLGKKEISKKQSSNTINATTAMMPIIGVKQIVSGSCPHAFIGQGPLCYTMTQPLSNDQDRFNLELTVSFYSEKNDYHQQQALQERSFPSSFSSNFYGVSEDGTPDIVLTKETSHPLDLYHTDTNPIYYVMDMDKHILYHCQQGDYLTFYVRGRGHPTWRRYMVKLNEHSLLLFDESHKNVGRIPLKPLQFVTYASNENDQECVLMSSTTGLVLGYERTCAKLMEPARLEENEVLQGKVYAYADNIKYATYWKQLLDVYANYPKDIDSSQHQRSNHCHDDEKINLRFMW
ncbi:hypothetical protein BDA99DRAFT_533496 [Phascolomyces articulosus]|uniref:Uncharacterized protein n=1 Tax=Phascolomyces articulosus TaxID=60185 RepID=A0AAD5PHM7_9FUNG|nr:hypothetical protein BDA99DRAFT_533496 [Phascolomyces articulosus]